jgi:outer membrane protein OmpA-like peptidoglycan-associated protein
MKKWTLPLLIVGTLCLTLLSNKAVDQSTRERLSTTINSDFQEVRPLISADGNTLYFSRRYHPGNTGGIKDFQDIWVSQLKNGQWSQPNRMPKPFNNKKANTLCSVTADGSYAILLDSYKRVKTPVAQVMNSPAGWGAPDELDIESFTNFSSYYDFFYNEQSEVLLMAIDNGSGLGEQDLHVSFKAADGTYTSPMNLGATVNTKRSDFAPFLAPDGKTLFFASYGHKGMGGSDYFVSYRLDESWKHWTTPRNLGSGINSKDDENYLSVTADYTYVYFESYPKGSSEKDIYRAALPRECRPERLKLSDQEQLFTSNESVNISSPSTGIRGKGKGQVQSPADNHASSASNSKISFDKLPTKQYLADGKINARILENNYFDYNSYQLTAACMVKLSEIAQLMKNNTAIEAKLLGHSDSWGTYNANLRVSYLRAQAVAHYLIDQGIQSHRLLVLAKGDQIPLASNDDEKEGRELNRRVEITLISPAGASLHYTLR